MLSLLIFFATVLFLRYSPFYMFIIATLILAIFRGGELRLNPAHRNMPSQKGASRGGTLMHVYDKLTGRGTNDFD